MNNQPYINGEGHKVLEYLSNDTIVLDLPFIMTQDKRLTKGMPYLKVEKKTIGEDIAAIRLIDFDDKDGIISLYVQELKSKKTYFLSANMDYDGEMWFWCLTDFYTLTSST